VIPALLTLLALAGQLPATGLPDDGCLGCHGGIEDMHPWQALSCTDCHGGDGRSSIKEAAHVQPRVGWPKDERVRSRSFEPAFARFRNPADLRVADVSCGACHGRLVEHLEKSLHGTTAGHLNDGLYENGVNPTRQAIYSVFSVQDDDVRSEHGLAQLRSVGDLRPPRRSSSRGGGGELAPHAADLPRKACNQCHLYSEGVGLTGRLGQDGLYRGEGCAACHVPYAENGLSASGDVTIDRFEPGHPKQHVMVTAPPTGTCVSCHIGDASIGNSFRGLAQLYPNMPAGPDIPGTTDRLLAEQFFLQDERRLPPDLHHAAGMNCVDCHGVGDVMGDGDIYGAMEHGVAIECSSCHGTPDAVASGRNERGKRITNLEQKGGLFVLRSKVTDRAHRVKQAAHVVDPDHPDYNPRAALAMTADHGRLECYACHSGWNPNFFGFHFDRNEGFSQLDTTTGQRTTGTVSTQERVFASMRQFVLGLNSEGMFAPYMVGFSSMGTVHADDGSLSVDQGLPRTAEGLSGMTMIHHQTHTTQPVARSCVECHRSPSTWGLGTGGDTGGSFALQRGLAVAVGERGVETLLLDREDPGRSTYLARLPLGGAERVVLDADPVTGRASTAFVALQAAGVVLVDIRNPAFPEPRAFVAAGDVRDLALAGDMLLIANGEGGLRIVDVSDRDGPVLLADLATREARGLDIAWPRVFVADGPGGLLVADVSNPSQPRVVGQTRLLPPLVERPDDATDVATLFQYGRPDGPNARSEARLLGVVTNGENGMVIMDLTEPEQPLVMLQVGGVYGGGYSPRWVTLASRYELGDTTGVTPTAERDLVYLTAVRDDGNGRLFILDVTDPMAPRRADSNRGAAALSGPAVLARAFNPPQLVTRLLVPNGNGLSFVDVTDSEEPAALANLGALGPLRHVAVEAFAFDRMLDESGRQLKDISHEGSRFLTPEEIHRVLSVPSDVLGRAEATGSVRAEVSAAFGDAAVPGGVTGASLPTLPFQPDPDGETARRLRLGFSIGPAEPMARMLRHVDPMAYDKNGDYALTRGEFERLLFDVLDVNGDGRLDLLEWPRHPDEDPSRLDRNRDELVTRAEMDVSKQTFGLLDIDGDGTIAQREWPFEVLEDIPPTLTYTTPEDLRKVISGIGWAKQNLALYERVAGSFEIKPHDVPDERLEQLVTQSRNNPLVDLAGQPSVGEFVMRWDVDRDGKVEASEYSPLPALAERIDLSGDGRVDASDKPERPRR
jgi:hypothetical protein